jgi:hypothetical protein
LELDINSLLKIVLFGILAFVSCLFSRTNTQIPDTVASNAGSTNVAGKFIKNKVEQGKQTVISAVKNRVRQTSFKVSGNKSLEITSSKFHGDPAYKPAETYTPYRRVETARILANANLFGLMNAEAEIIQSSEGDDWGFNLDKYKPHIKLDARDFGLEFGDCTVDFPNSEFVLKNKAVSGFKTGIKTEPLDVILFYATPKGKNKKAEFYGDGTQGPYDLDTAGFVIVSDTVTVKLNGIEQKQGLDFEVDEFNGQVLFLRRAIGINDRIEAEYQYVESGYNRYLFGSSLLWKIGNGNKLGLDFAFESDKLRSFESALVSGATNLDKPRRDMILDLIYGFRFEPGLKFLNTINLEGEAAWDRQDLDLSERGTGEKNRFAVKGKTGLRGKGWETEAAGRWVEKDYTAIGNGDIRNNSYDYSAYAKIDPIKAIGYRIDFAELRYVDVTYIPDLEYDRLEMKNKLDIKPSKVVSLSALRRDFVENNNMPVTNGGLWNGYAENSADVTFSLPKLDLVMGGIWDDYDRKAPKALKDRRLERGGRVGLTLKDIRWLTLNLKSEVAANESEMNDSYLSWRAEGVFEFKPVFRKSHATNAGHVSRTNTSGSNGANRTATSNVADRGQDVFVLRLKGSFSSGDLHRSSVTTNTQVSPTVATRPAGPVWIMEGSYAFTPSRVIKHETGYKINNFKEFDGTDEVEIHQHSGSTRLEIKPAKTFDFGYRLLSAFNWRPDKRRSTQWSWNHTLKTRWDILKSLRTTVQYRMKELHIRPKLEPLKLQHSREQEVVGSARFNPAGKLAINLDGTYIDRVKNGYYDIAIDDPFGDYSLKLARMLELRKNLRLEVSRALPKGFQIASDLRIERYELIDASRIAGTRYATATPDITAANLADLNYQEIIGGLKIGWTPAKWCIFSLTYARSALFDKSGARSQKNTDILKPGLDMIFFKALRFHADLQQDMAYYVDETKKPSRTVLNSSLGFDRGPVKLNASVKWEGAEAPDYESLFGKVSLNMSF